MTDFNLVNLKQDNGLLGASQKLKKGNAGKEQVQMLPFLCIMGQICRITTQETEKILFNSPPGKGKMCGLFKKGNTNGQRGVLNIDSENNILSAGNDKAKKTNQSFQAEKGKGLVKNPHRAIPGSQATCLRSTHRQAGRIHSLTGPEPGPLKPGLNKQIIESALPKSGLTGVVVEKNETFKESRGKRIADTVGANFKDVKNAAAVFRDGGIKESWAGRNSHATEDTRGLLKFSLKKADAVKGKSALEPDRTEKNSFTLVKSGGKNDIGNPLKHLDLKGEEAIEILHRGIPQPVRPSDRGFSAGGYQRAAFHADSGSAVINESVNSYGVEPRALINQIASGMKRSGRVRIMLNPLRLGTLGVNVLIRDNNKVHVILQAENNDVRQTLQSNVESLKSSLRDQGLVADTINVSVQEKPDSGNYGSGRNETLFREGGNREGEGEDRSGRRNSSDHAPSFPEEEKPSVRIDGHLSLFV